MTKATQAQTSIRAITADVSAETTTPNPLALVALGMVKERSQGVAHIVVSGDDRSENALPPPEVLFRSPSGALNSKKVINLPSIRIVHRLVELYGIASLPKSIRQFLYFKY